jgi:hypothetical protein
MMRVRLLASASLATLLIVATAGAATPSRSVLIIGDSVATGMLWHNDAIAVVQKNLEVQWDVAICRSVAGTSCPFEGERPPTLVESVEARGTVAPVVVVEAGYNDPVTTFAADIDAAMSALVAAGAQRVLWLTLPAAVPPFPRLNTMLAQALARWPQLELVDWDAASAGHTDWFQNDGVHLLASGGLAMAHLVHGAVLGVVDPLRVVDGPLQLRAGRAYTMRLRAAGGTRPYRWRVAGGRPPRGFHLLADGRLTAAPNAGAPTSFTVAVTDADGVTATLGAVAR